MAFQLLTEVDAVKAGTGTLGLVATGVAWDDTTYAEGLEFANDGKTFLFVSNREGAAATVTLGWIPVADPDGRIIPDSTLTTAVADDEDGIMGPFLPRIWNSVLGRIQFLPDDNDANMKYVAIRIDNPT